MRLAMSAKEGVERSANYLRSSMPSQKCALNNVWRLGKHVHALRTAETMKPLWGGRIASFSQADCWVVSVATRMCSGRLDEAFDGHSAHCNDRSVDSTSNITDNQRNIRWDANNN